MLAAFLPQELAQRREAAGRSVAEHGIGALLALRTEVVHWLTGAEPSAEAPMLAVLVEADGRATLLTEDPARMSAASLDALAVDDLRPWTAESDAGAGLPALLLERGLRDVPIAVDGHVAAVRGLQRLPENSVNWTAAGNLIESLRARKSPRELAYIRRAAGLADDAFDTALACVEPGAWEGDILAAMQAAVMQGGGHLPTGGFRVASGDRRLADLASAPRRRLSDPDRVALAWAGVYRGYPAGRTCTLTLGAAAADSLQAVATEALAATRAACRPGAACADVFHAGARVVEQAGLRMGRDCGHAASPQFHPALRPEPVLGADDTAALASGMALVLRVDVVRDDNGQHVTVGETVEVTETGAVSLHRESPAGSQ